MNKLAYTIIALFTLCIKTDGFLNITPKITNTEGSVSTWSSLNREK